MSERLTTNAVPNPGTIEAISKGCTCPILDNAHGRGYYGNPDVFIFTEGCPLHWPFPRRSLLRSIEGARMNEVADLLARIEAATGPDRGLDFAIHSLFPLAHAGIPRRTRPAYTASIDAALALVERVRPGCMWRVRSDPDSGDCFAATLVPEDGDVSSGVAATPALAILVALLRSIEGGERG